MGPLLRDLYSGVFGTLTYTVEDSFQISQSEGMLVIVVHRYPSWVGLLVASLTWKLAWSLLVSGKIVLREEAFQFETSWSSVQNT